MQAPVSGWASAPRGAGLKKAGQRFQVCSGDQRAAATSRVPGRLSEQSTGSYNFTRSVCRRDSWVPGVAIWSTI